MLTWTKNVVCLVATLGLLLTSFVEINGQVPDWFSKLLGVKIGASSAADIEHLFPEARLESEFTSRGLRTVLYMTRAGKLTVTYTNGPCVVSRPGGIEMAKGKVLEVFFSVRQETSIKRLGVSTDSMYRYVEDDNPTEHFMDRAKGIDFSVQKNKIRSLTIFVPDLWHQIAEQSRSSKTPDPYASLVCED